ncbi:MAG: AAA family ATPase [Chitinophagales bacterium]
MSEKKDTSFIAYKFRDLKIYGSSEWLANEQKKYRRVFDRSEASYIYAEFSFYNKLFDQEDWKMEVTLKAFALRGTKKQELCKLTSVKEVSKESNIVYIREGWGNKKTGLYWKKGTYLWEAYIEGKLIASQKFWVEDVGVVTEDNNPYFSIESIKLYEGPDNNIPINSRTYYKGFDGKNARYVFVEFAMQNLVVEKAWNCEVFFKFYNDAHQLKGETVEVFHIKPTDKTYTITSGWGSNDKGTWFHDNYTLEIIFMDHLVAILPFEVSDAFEEGMSEALIPSTGAKLIPKEQEQPQTFEEVMSDLEALIGLQTVKQRIKEYAEYLKFVKIRIEKGFEDAQKINLHAVFTGNPGTGKTTVANMLGRIYKHMGLLSKGHVHEVDRADLVGEYIGQTAPKVKEAIKNARGGILFIDEAYSLARAKDDLKDFGREVIEILVKEMSDGTGDLSIIVAGYPSEMRTFMDANPGLKSRFTQWFEFPDYIPQELADIAEYAANKRNILLTPQSKAFLYSKIVEAYRTRDRFFGNARYVNSLISEAKINLGLRVMKQESPKSLSKEDLSTLIVEDFEKIFKQKEKTLPDIPINEELLAESLEELNALVGLAEVKKEISELVQLVRFYREIGKDVLNKFSLHSVFTGNPGTGKTTVARILSGIFKALGVLERGHLVECDRHSLVAGYVGQTALKTSEKIDAAIGGVLFIDEAYALTQRGQTDFGKEAIETLIKRMEDQKGQFAVVVAGYPDPMKSFLESNPGFKSRFDRLLVFEDFSVKSLLEIAVRKIEKEGYTIEEDAKTHLRRYLGYLQATKDSFFGNGRTVVKTIDEIIKNQNLRLAAMPKEERTDEMLKNIILMDVEMFDERKAVSGGRKRLGFTRTGSTTS